MQHGGNWHSGQNEFSVDLENTGKNTQFKIYPKSKVKVIILLFYERNKIPKNNNKQKKFELKWHLLLNDQTADTTLLLSHDELSLHSKVNAVTIKILCK